ncbi:NAD(P)-dependent oxidoreductase [uncultured Desulfosarcina sp.]|uniref:NAD-dependent epimerase/dehydratase family protein n=1 Tax=uncultured Desulfosarcina sp. TaxID=218289 RepID=UPI0029C7F1E1|nr:NAD(P)-dependent oxidoreductase [uncultured Desulfosarcina sp.]
MVGNKIFNGGPSYRAAQAPRALPCGLARLPSICHSETYQLVMDYHNRGIIRATIIRPANVIGPGSVWVADFADALKRKSRFPVIDNGRHHAALVYVENLVDGIMLALEKEIAHGKTYHFRDDYDENWKTYIEDIAAITEKKVNFSNVPFGLAWSMATFVDTFIKPLGLKVDLTRHTVGLTGRANDVDASRAKEELGWKTRVSYETAMAKIAKGMQASAATN